MNALIGYTGFVGQNLDNSLFTAKFNSKNIFEIRNRSFELLVCAGVPGHKTLANQFPENDWNSISLLMDNLTYVQCDKFVLISTVDVLPQNKSVSEDYIFSSNDLEALHPYGKHRVRMEEFVRKRFPSASIIRLPGIFGKGLRKNFIFDLIFQIPRFFSIKEFTELKERLSVQKGSVLENDYQLNANGVLELRPRLQKSDILELREIMRQVHCTSLRFTDSRSRYSYYDLSWIQNDIKRIIDLDIPLIHMATEPMQVAEIARRGFGIQFDNMITGREPQSYNPISKYSKFWGHSGNYLYDKEQVIAQLKKFDKNSIAF